jgi:hypothetical protein
VLFKYIIRLKNFQRHHAQRAQLTRNSGPMKRAKALFNMLNGLVQFLISKLNNDSFQNKIGTLRPGHKSFFNFTKLIKNKIRCIPALKVGGSTLITDAEKAAAIADRFAESHENSQISPLTNIPRASCSLFSAARRWFQHRYPDLYVSTGNQECRERTEERQFFVEESFS